MDGLEAEIERESKIESARERVWEREREKESFGEREREREREREIESKKEGLTFGIPETPREVGLWNPLLGCWRFTLLLSASEASAAPKHPRTNVDD